MMLPWDNERKDEGHDVNYAPTLYRMARLTATTLTMLQWHTIPWCEEQEPRTILEHAAEAGTRHRGPIDHARQPPPSPQVLDRSSQEHLSLSTVTRPPRVYKGSRVFILEGIWGHMTFALWNPLSSNPRL